MNKKELIFNYLLKNIDGDCKITIQNVVLAKEFGFTTQTISNIMKSLEGNGMISRDKKTITINKSKLVIDDILKKRNLNYSNKEKELLYYMYSEYQKKIMEGGFEYVCISYESIKQNTTITKGKVISMYLTKYQTDGILDILQGDWSKRQSNKYKFNFDILNIETEQQTQKINNNETIELLMKSIDELSEEITRMSERMDKMAKYCLTLKEDNEKLHQRLNQLENNSITPTREVANTCMVENIVTDNSYYQQKVNLSTTERIAIYNKFKEEKEKIIQYITDNLTQLEYADTLDDVLERMNVHHDMNIIYNQIGNDIDGIFYLLPKLNDVDGNLLVYRYLTDKVFLQRLKSIISNMN